MEINTEMDKEQDKQGKRGKRGKQRQRMANNGRKWQTTASRIKNSEENQIQQLGLHLWGTPRQTSLKSKMGIGQLHEKEQYLWARLISMGNNKTSDFWARLSSITITTDNIMSN